MNGRDHLAAASRFFGASHGELLENLIEGATRQAALLAALDPLGAGAEARIDAFLTHNYGMQKTALRLRELIGSGNA